MKKILIGIALLSLIPSFSAAETINPMNLPAATQFVEDFSQALSPADLASERKRAEDFEKKTGVQAVTVLFPNREGNELIDIGVKYFNENKIGKKESNDGILLLIATDEKKIRIVTGYGMEGKIPDLLASDIIEKSIRPKVNAGDLAGAINAYYDRVDHAVGSDEGAQVSKNGEPSPWQMVLFAAIFAFAWGSSGGVAPGLFMMAIFAMFSVGAKNPFILLTAIVAWFISFWFIGRKNVKKKGGSIIW